MSDDTDKIIEIIVRHLKGIIHELEKMQLESVK